MDGTQGSKTDSPDVELAARHLAAWRGTSAAWFANVEWIDDDGEAQETQGDSLTICRRGRTEESATGKVRRLRTWAQLGGVAAIPKQRSMAKNAAALSFAHLPGPLGPLLLLYACEDWSQWGIIERFAVACYPHPEAIRDAMARILWRTAEVSQDERARQLKTRAATYRMRTARAERMLRDWLDRAARAYLRAMHSDGTDLHPASDLNSRGPHRRPSSRAAPRHGQQLTLDLAA